MAVNLGVGGLGGVVGFGVVGVTVDKLNADLLGEGQLNLLASWGSKLGDALLNRLSGVLDLWDGDALVLNLVLAADTGKEDGLVDTGLDWLRVGDGHINIDGGDNRDIVLSGLGNLVAVVVAIASMSVATIGGGADSHHLDLGLFLESNLHCGSCCSLILAVVVVRAHFVGNFLNGLSADSPSDIVAEPPVHNGLDWQVDVLTDCFKCGGANFSNFCHILGSAILLGLLVTPISSICWGRMPVWGWGWVSVGRWGWVPIGRGWMAWKARGQWDESEDGGKDLG